MLTPEQFNKVMEMLAQIGSTAYALGEKGTEVTLKAIFYKYLFECFWDIAFIAFFWKLTNNLYTFATTDIQNKDKEFCEVVRFMFIPIIRGVSFFVFIGWFTKDLFAVFYPEGMLLLMMLKKLGIVL